MATKDMVISPVGRVEGDLDVRVTIEDNVVVNAWTEAAMFRGFEIILRGKDPQAGLIVTPRICGICGGSHLYKSAYALDTAWRTELPPNAILIRNIAQAAETMLSIPRWFYALFAIDLTNKNTPGPKGTTRWCVALLRLSARGMNEVSPFPTNRPRCTPCLVGSGPIPAS